ncbi:MAG: rhomboid family intramembrane serine protease [Planctomycetes bacterium]|nr:rhomboid family intramembrane serine protease [Planctomycetota bacterium]NUQ33339.1 rhomboid family intramembrane serine protease [Planctomycetaceae bacterium]
MTLIILWTTVAVTAAQFMDERQVITEYFKLAPADLWRGWYWQLLTVTLVHGDPLHLAMNCLGLWVFGSILEPMIGKPALAFLYVLSALGGSVAIVMTGEVAIATVGASGAIYGLFGVLVGYAYGRFGSLSGMWNSVAGSRLIVILVYLVVTSFRPNVSVAGHIGGLIVGLLLGYLLERKHAKTILLGEKIGAGIVFALVIGLSIYVLTPVHRGAYWMIKSGEAVDHRLKNGEWTFLDSGQSQDIELARDYFKRIGPDVDKTPEYGRLKESLHKALFGPQDSPKHEPGNLNPPAPVATPESAPTLTPEPEPTAPTD